MKKLLPFVLISLSMLWSCSLFSKSWDHTFESDYKNAVGYAMDVDISLPQFLKDVTTNSSKSGYDSSWMKLVYDIQNQSSGSLSFLVDWARETYKKLSSKMALSGSIELPSGEISSIDTQSEFIVDSQAMKYYGKIDTFSLDWFLAQEIPWVKEVSSYLWKWYLYDYMHNISSVLEQNASQKYLTRILQSEIWFIIDIRDNWFVTLRELIQSNPIFVPTGSGNIQWETIVYPVWLSYTWLLNFSDAFLVQYSWSGLTADEKQQFVEGLKDVQFQWTLSISLSENTYSTLSGLIITTNTLWETENESIFMQFEKDKTQISLQSASGSFVSTLSKWSNDSWTYILDASNGEDMIRAVDASYSKQDSWNTLKVALETPTESGWILEVNWDNEDFNKFSWYIGDVTKKNYFEVSGTREEDVLRSLNGKFVTQDKIPNEIINFSYSRSVDDTYTWEIIIPEVQLEFNWKAKKEDFLFETIVQWMSIRLENKKLNETDWKWLISLPVAKVDWFIKNEKQILRDVKANITSPFITAKVDMKSNGDWSRWTYVVSTKWEVVSTGKIGLMKKPKYLGMRVESIIQELWSQLPSFFEIVGMTDIKWDENVHIDIPKDAILFDNFSEQSLNSWLNDKKWLSNDTIRMAWIRDISNSVGAYYADREYYPISESWCFPVQGMDGYFGIGIPKDPIPWRLSWNCDGKNGTTYGYGTFTYSNGNPGYYIIAELEDPTLGNSSSFPEQVTDETAFWELKKWSWKYYIQYK